MREVRRAQSARFMDLTEEYFLLGTMRRSPATNTALQCPQLTILELAGILSLKPCKQRPRLQSRGLHQSLLDLVPDPRKGIHSRPPRVTCRQFAGQPWPNSDCLADTGSPWKHDATSLTV